MILLDGAIMEIEGSISALYRHRSPRRRWKFERFAKPPPRLSLKPVERFNMLRASDKEYYYVGDKSSD